MLEQTEVLAAVRVVWHLLIQAALEIRLLLLQRKEIQVGRVLVVQVFVVAVVAVVQA
jgi:hypothetical protein